MKRFCTVLLLACVTAVPAYADMDVEMEKRDAVKREAARQAEESKQREMQRMRKEAEDKANAATNKHLMDSKRKALGAAAKGKSDEEVNRLHEAKMKTDTAHMNKTVEAARGALSQGQGADALKQTTGKSMKELENMSDAEAEAMIKEMEKKYGK